MTKKIVITVMLSALTMTMGCASIRARCGCESQFGAFQERGNPRYVYPGTQVAGEMTSCLPDGEMAGWNILIGLTGLFDLPLCIAADTLLLPYDLYKVTIGGYTRYGHLKKNIANKSLERDE